MITIHMWDKIPGLCEQEPVLEYFPAENKKTNATCIIFPGGGYAARARHEGRGYAQFLNRIGMDAFVCQYRCAPHKFPLPLLDARRAVRYVRSHAEEYGINPEKVAVMGSSAGGHLAAMISTYRDPIDFEDIDDIDKRSPIPNATILCYPVCHKPDELNIAHVGSFYNLLGQDANFEKYSPDLLVSGSTPPAFIWHNSDDDAVDVRNSYLYASALRVNNINHEIHVFPKGGHGLGLAYNDPHVAQWSGLLKNWFTYMSWLE
ncbi:MAG: alpha/beta hydrolase [Clostridia bacterium]|nr:alpha/beta hydrolase [Clostridia bacterium]